MYTEKNKKKDDKQIKVILFSSIPFYINYHQNDHDIIAFLFLCVEIENQNSKP